MICHMSLRYTSPCHHRFFPTRRTDFVDSIVWLRICLACWFAALPRCGAVMFLLHMSVCLCLYVCNALNFESVELQSSFLIRRHIFRISRSLCRGQGHGSKKRVSVSCSRVVCLQLKGNLFFLVFVTIFAKFWCSIIEQAGFCEPLSAC